MQNVTDVTILCKVVDNFGDIGFVHRLSKNLHKINPTFKIRIVVSDLNAFKKIAPEIDSSVARQNFFGMEVFDWNADEICYEEFSENPPQVMLECFQCGRPDWLDAILFDENSGNVFQIINIDYLTAENYAEEFHCLKSGTRSANVKKVNFMPGFTAKTGGLILDEPFIQNADKFAIKSDEEICDNLSQNFAINCDLKILVFSYPKDFVPIIFAIENYRKSRERWLDKFPRKKSDEIAYRKSHERRLDKFPRKKSDEVAYRKSREQQFTIFLSQGVGKESFLKACVEFECAKTEKDVCANDNAKLSQIFQLKELSFLSQVEWDKMLLAMDILFVRGEDSLSRACLCGKPFVWNAYPQDDDYQLVKVNALLERMRCHFSENEFDVVKKFWLLYNGQDKKDALYSKKLEDACFEFLINSCEIKHGFEDFSKSLFSNGNFTEKLNEFISLLNLS